MNTIHYKHKVDVNQKEIVQVIRKAGGLVQILSMVGGGVFDLLVLFRGDLYLIEVKDGKNGLTDAQERFYAEWGSCAKVGIVRTPDEALKFIGAVK